MKMYVRFLEALGPWFRRKFAWAPHNLVAHPLSEFWHWFGFNKAADWIHESTIPDVPEDEQRG